MAAGEADAPGGAAKKRTAFAARALAGSPRRPVCLFWSAARARSRAPPPGMFASALPPARLRVCPAAGYAYFGLPPALAAALRRPVCLLQPAARALAGSPRCPVCLFWSAARARSRAAPLGMFASACRPRTCGFAAPRGCAFGRPWAPISAPRRPVCLFWSAARALAGSPFCKRNGANALPCRPRACGFAAPPGMLISAPPRRRAARESTPARGR